MGNRLDDQITEEQIAELEAMLPELVTWWYRPLSLEEIQIELDLPDSLYRYEKIPPRLPGCV